MRRTICIAVALTILSGQAAFAAPAAAAPTGRTICSLVGWSNDPDPRGLNVRAGPSRSTKIVGVLPQTSPAVEDADDVEFDIVASQNGWFQIRNARASEGDLAAGARIFKGTGWVAAGMVGYDIQSARGYARPDDTSPRIVDLGDEWIGGFDRLIACDGKFLLGEKVLRPPEYPGKPRRIDDRAYVRPGVIAAWFQRICANQKTTCDSLTDPPD